MFTEDDKVGKKYFFLTKNLDMCGTPHFVVMVVRRKSSNNIEQMVQQPEMEILFPIIKLPNFRFDIIIIKFEKKHTYIY